MVLSLQSNLAKTVWSVVIFAVLFSRAVPCSAQAVLEPRHFDISAGGRFAPFHPIFVHNHIDRSLTRQTGMFNYAAGLDLTGTYQIDKRLSVSAVLPVAFNTLSLFLPTRPLPGWRVRMERGRSLSVR